MKSVQGKVKHLKKVENEFSRVNEQTLLFLDLYVESGSAPESWLAAGYSEATKKNAMSKVRDNWRIVEKLIKGRIGSHVPMALNGIITLAQSAKGETVRLKAQQDILYRAGYDKPVEFVMEDKDANALKDSELQDELAKLLALKDAIA